MEKIAQLSAEEQQLTSLAFNHLVDKQETKIPYPLLDLAKLIDREPKQLGITLDKDDNIFY